MAKKKGQQQQKEPVKVEAVKVEEDENDDEEDELELLQVDLGDMIKLKQVLDEAVAAAVLERIEEDYGWDNIKLGLMTAACGFAIVAQFAETIFTQVPFPDSRPILGLCCCCYFVLSGILQLITIFVDQDSILLTKPKLSSKNEDLKRYGIRVRSQFPSFTEYFTIVLEYQKGSSEDTNSGPSYVKQRWSVGQFFDKEGFFDEVGLSVEIGKLFNRLEDGTYDNDKALTEAEKKNQ